MANLIAYVIVLDLFINTFFHLIQLRNFCVYFCDNEVRNVILRLVSCIERLDSSVRAGESAQIELHKSIREVQGRGEGPHGQGGRQESDAETEGTEGTCIEEAGDVYCF